MNALFMKHAVLVVVALFSSGCQEIEGSPKSDFDSDNEINWRFTAECLGKTYDEFFPSPLPIGLANSNTSTTFFIVKSEDLGIRIYIPYGFEEGMSATVLNEVRTVYISWTNDIPTIRFVHDQCSGKIETV